VRKTAVPGTRWGGFFSSIATSAASGVSSRRVFSVNRRVAAPPGIHHRHQHGAERQRHPAALDDLKQIGAEEVTSMTTNGAIRAAAASGDQCQTFQTTTKANHAGHHHGPVTAMP